MTDNCPITALSADPRSKTLAAGNSNGFIVIFSCFNETGWKPLHSIAPPTEIPCMSLGLLFRGENLYVAGFANGHVILISPDQGFVVAEISAHSRQLNALACHPIKSVFATCSDDTFVNIFEVSGDKIDKLEVSLVMASRVNDYMMVGVAFGGEKSNSLVATPFDFRTIVVWNNIV